MLSLLLILISKSWGCPPKARHAFPRHQHMRKRGGYLFLPGFSSLYDAIHGWMTRRTDGWTDGLTDGWTGHVKMLHEKQSQRPSLYVIIYNGVPSSTTKL
jgi:hypothetical protein